MPETRHDPIEIFRPGRRTASNGETVTFSDEALRATAAAYDPALHEAPIVVGHPKHDDPAYGWVESMTYADGSLSASPHQINADFAELVRGGAFKKVSASFYKPDAAANPRPGVYYLRHVGFLGAQPPSLKGLKAVEFEDSEDGVLTVEFADAPAGPVASAFRMIGNVVRGLRDYIIERDGVEAADRIVPSWTVDEISSVADDVAGAGADTPPAFTEEETDMPNDNPAAATTEGAAELDERVAAIASDREVLDRERAEFAEARARAEAESFVEAQVAAGRLLPAEQDGLVAFMAALDGDDAISFGEDDERTPAAFFRSFVEKLPQRVDFTERSPEDGEPVDTADPEAVAAEAVAYREEMAAKGVVVSTTDAVLHVTRGAAK